MIHEPPQQIIEGATRLRAYPRPWSDADIARLTELWGTKDTCARKIAAELGYSRNATIGKARRLGLQQLQPRRSVCVAWTPKDCADAIDLWKQDLPIKIIAHRIGRTFSGVSKKLSEMGFRRPHGYSNNQRWKAYIKAEGAHPIPKAPKPIVSKDAPWRALESAWVPLPSTTPIEFMEHTHRTCHWPIGNEYPFKWCGAARIKNCSYCQSHHDMAVQVVEG